MELIFEPIKDNYQNSVCLGIGAQGWQASVPNFVDYETSLRLLGIKGAILSLLPLSFSFWCLSYQATKMYVPYSKDVEFD